MLSSVIKLPTGLHFFERGWLSSNNILLEDGGQQSILIDTGYWTHADQTVHLVRSVLHASPLQRIINTHLHSDHCGGNASLQCEYAGVRTQIPPGLSAHVFDWDPAALSYEPTGQHCPPFVASDLIRPGDEFEIADMVWQAYAAPGHDPDSLIFFSPTHQLLISADALWENGFGVVFPELEGIEAFDTVEHTLDLIESLRPRVVLPGHGSVFECIDDALSRARSRVKQFKNDPVKHARYASKVLLKFKLLEVNNSSLNEFMGWASNCELLRLVHQTHFKSSSLRSWTLDLLDELVKANAAQFDADSISNC